MAYWTGEKIVYFDPQPYPEYPGWELIDCGCCAGIEWGGDYPNECNTCGGGGYIARHIKTNITAKWPGGPFC